MFLSPWPQHLYTLLTATHGFVNLINRTPRFYWEIAMTTKLQARISEIHKRIKEYHKHKNDPYAFYPGEIDAVREVGTHAVKDIEFLLALLYQKSR